jgi:predicted DNA-binding antitoxin AbrB/MazE fold protein
MSQQIDAIYVDGVLKPLVPLALPDQTRVKLTVDATTAQGTVGPDESGGEANGGASEFDRELEPLLFDGPSLPANFSRADIYADHD